MTLYEISMVVLLGLSTLACQTRDSRSTGTVTCTEVDDALLQQWSLGQHEQLRACIVAADPTVGSALADELLARFDAHAEAWLAAQRSACQSTMPQYSACLQVNWSQQAMLVEVAQTLSVDQLYSVAAGIYDLNQGVLDCGDPLEQDYYAAGEEDQAALALRRELAQARILDVLELDTQMQQALLRATARAQETTSAAAILQLMAFRGWLELAAHHHTESLTIAREMMSLAEDSGHELVAGDAAGLCGLAAYAMTDYAVALGCFERAVDVFERELGPTHPETSAALNNLGGAYVAIRAFERTLDVFTKVIENDVHTWGPEYDRLAVYYDNMGSIYGMMGDSDQALTYFEKSRVMRERKFGTDNPEVARVYENLGLYYSEGGEQTRALELLNTALAIRERHLQPTDPALVRTLSHLATVHQRMGRHETALAYAQRALDMHTTLFGAQHPALATSHQNIGVVLSAAGRCTEALGHLQVALALIEKHGSEYEVGVALHNLGYAHYCAGSFPDALEFYRRARATLEQTSYVDAMLRQLSANIESLCREYPPACGAE